MTRQPGALRRMARASSAEIGLSNSILTASEWPMNTGTRTQVATILIFGSRIFFVFTKEEWKMVVETKKKIDQKIKMVATCVRVATILIFGSRIFFVSTTIFHSSLVKTKK